MTVAEILPAALAPVPVVILAACLLLSFIVPAAAGRLVLLGAIAVAAIVFLAWATSDATSCDASCSTSQDALTVAALAIGPGTVLLLLLVAAFRIGADDRTRSDDQVDARAVSSTDRPAERATPEDTPAEAP